MNFPYTAWSSIAVAIGALERPSSRMQERGAPPPVTSCYFISHRLLNSADDLDDILQSIVMDLCLYFLKNMTHPIFPCFYFDFKQRVII